MRVYRPTNNVITGGYTASHRAYDFAGNGVPDEVRAGQDGTIIERVDQYSTNWTATGALTTKDYGNYIKVKHNDGSFELHAHLKLGSSLVVGTAVKAGQTIARIGNTGNSSGPHLHSEYRNASNVNQVAEFYVDVEGGDSEMAEPNFKEFVLRTSKSIYGDDYNENWNDAEKKAFLDKREQKEIDYKKRAEQPVAPSDPKADRLKVALKEFLA